MTEPSPESPLEELLGELQKVRTDLRAARTLTRRQTGAMWIIGLLVLAVIVGGVVLWRTLQEVEDTQRTSCENANQTRAAQIYLWDTLILQSGARNPEQTPEQKAYARAFGEFIHGIFAPRDCTDPDQMPELPDPPKIPRS